MLKTAVLAILLCSFSLASTSDEWLEQVPQSIGPSQNWTPIPRESFFEVPASKLDAAKVWLAKDFILDQADASYFDQPNFKCSRPSSLYLVRALYLNGGTGHFDLKWAGSAVVVSHASLGAATRPVRSVLVACLAKRPTAVYASISADM
jgi:hypothetical protein